ncbi:MAG: hypothetical protein M9926_00635 [Lentimicrobium sp.]|uniref:helix-turn-helix domain-containing protein n=1 Tax=Lentimicrobium sp. TaxID=2034841 RepID=UPI0025E06084|nr:helix-turn-helix domain-containing protein [Lentimicrobium sp.]MCO5255237.1 hypothetical protein [Lentimicrobium sp.]
MNLGGDLSFDPESFSAEKKSASKESSGNDKPGGTILNLAEAEKQTILSALRATESNISQTARLLGISRNALYEKMKRHGIG